MILASSPVRSSALYPLPSIHPTLHFHWSFSISWSWPVLSLPYALAQAVLCWQIPLLHILPSLKDNSRALPLWNLPRSPQSALITSPTTCHSPIPKEDRAVPVSELPEHHGLSTSLLRLYTRVVLSFHYRPPKAKLMLILLLKSKTKQPLRVFVSKGPVNTFSFVPKALCTHN